MYSGLAVLMLYPYQNKKLNLFRFRVYLVIVIVGITFGFLVELIQGNFIHQRYFGWSDIVANSIGTIFGAFLYGWIGRKIV